MLPNREQSSLCTAIMCSNMLENLKLEVHMSETIEADTKEGINLLCKGINQVVSDIKATLYMKDIKGNEKSVCF